MRKSQKEINQLKKALTSHFKMTDLGPVTHYHGLDIIKDVIANTIFLCQETYIRKFEES